MNFRNLTNGRDRVEVEGRTLRQVIDQLDKECPGFKDQVVVDDAIRPGLAVAIDEDMASEGLLQPIPDGGTVHILPALGGG